MATPGYPCICRLHPTTVPKLFFSFFWQQLQSTDYRPESEPTKGGKMSWWRSTCCNTPVEVLAGVVLSPEGASITNALRDYGGTCFPRVQGICTTCFIPWRMKDFWIPLTRLTCLLCTWCFFLGLISSSSHSEQHIVDTSLELSTITLLCSFGPEAF